MPGEREICAGQRDGGETVRHRGIRRYRHAIGVQRLKVILQLGKVAIVLVIEASGIRQRLIDLLVHFDTDCLVL